MLRINSSIRQKLLKACEVLCPNHRPYISGSRSSFSQKKPLPSSDIDLYLFGPEKGPPIVRSTELTEQFSLAVNQCVDVVLVVEDLEAMMTDTMEPLREAVTHPAGFSMTQAPWVGPEIEGYLTVPSLFLPCRLPAESWLKDIEQVFVTESFVEDAYILESLRPLCRKKGLLLTVARPSSERESIKRLLGKVALFVRLPIELEWLRDLGPNDQFSAGVPFDLVSWRGSHGVVTLPHQYMEDSQ